MDKTILEDGIAIIGMSCRFPDAVDLKAYWQNLCQGKVSACVLDAQDLMAAGVNADLMQDSSYVPVAYPIKNIDMFDPAFFGYAGSEAEKIDPQQRFFLECAWESLEDAGYSPLLSGGLDKKNVGVFAGSRLSSYTKHVFKDAQSQGGADAFSCLVGNDKDYLCTRVSYKLNLHGPSLSVQSACSSSLASVHIACENLRSGACDMALAGGVAIDIPQEKGYFHQEGMIFSPDGYCRPFDANAGGTVFSGGAGVVVLKRLEDALRDRDSIYAVVLSSVINNDGAQRVGYTAPGEFGQSSVIGEAIAFSGLSARDIGYVETHGTGTALGDSIEFASLNKVFTHFTQDKQFCALGAVKANIGHADVASGIASFIKAVMAVHTGDIPPHPLFTQANPAINLDASPFYINDKVSTWKDQGQARTAGISSFGIGGSNAHVIIAQAPDYEQSVVQAGAHLFTLSSRNEAMLRTLAGHMAQAFDDEDVSLLDVCYTCRESRSKDKARLAIAVESLAELKAALQDFADGNMPKGLEFVASVIDAPDKGRVSIVASDDLASVAKAYMAGEPKALSALQELALQAGAKRVHLPVTPFQRRRCWPKEQASEQLRTSIVHPVWRSRFIVASQVFYEGILEGEEFVRMQDHQVRGKSIAPASLFLELMIAASHKEFSQYCTISRMAVLQPLRLDSVGKIYFQLSMSGDKGSEQSLELFASASPEDTSSWRKIARAQLSVGKGQAVQNDAELPYPAQDDFTNTESADQYYATMDALGVHYGLAFRKIQHVAEGKGKALIHVQGNTQSWLWEPALFDACLQGVLACVPEQLRQTGRLFIPAGCHSLYMDAKAKTQMHVLVEMQDFKEYMSSDIQQFSVNVTIFDAQKQVIGRIQDLRMNELPSSALTSVEEASGASDYSINWIESTLPEEQTLSGSWLVLADSSAMRDALLTRIQKDGCPCSALTWDERASLIPMLESLCAGTDRVHIVHAWAMGKTMVDYQVDELYQRGVLTVLDIVHATQKQGKETELALVILTSKAAGPEYLTLQGNATASNQAVPAQSMLWGLAAVVAGEHLKLAIRLIDLENDDLSQQFYAILAHESKELVQALRADAYYVPRLAPLNIFATEKSEQSRALSMDGTGLDGLHWTDVVRRAPAKDEVEIVMSASSLNFRDAMMAMGIYPGESTAIGSDGAGYVCAVGDGVTELQVGDAVVVSSFGCFSSHVTVPAGMVCKIPDTLSMEDAAALPVVYITAWYALKHLAKVCAGKTVLIHAASGGVGLAAMSICRQAGARIFATAGSQEKREFVRNLGAELVMDSRSADFNEEIIKATDGKGVDIVLNSLAGELQDLSLNLVTEGGSFVEIGKSNVRESGLLKTDRGNIQYFPVDLVVLGIEEPELMRSIFQSVISGCAHGELDVLPVRTFAMEDYIDAFRFMVQTRHIGKIVLTWPHVQKPHAQKEVIGTELITGGLGALGLKLARNRFENGCRNIILVARRQPSSEEEQNIDDMRKQGCAIALAKADVSDYAMLRDAVTNALEGMPPLQKMWHLAGSLVDASLLELNANSFKKVLAPKVEGAWNLHTLSLELGTKLDAFVLFSSIASFMGSRNQGNYAAANAYLDELARYRRSINLPALTINWGAFGKAGMAVEHSNLEVLKHFGILGMSTQEAFSHMQETLAHDDIAQLSIMHMEWSKYAGLFAQGTIPKFMETIYEHVETGASFIVNEDDEDIAQASCAGVITDAAIESVVKNKVAHILRTETTSLDVHANLFELGIDSLLALDIFQYLEKEFQIRVERSALFEHPSINALSTHIAGILDAQNGNQDGVSADSGISEDAIPEVEPDVLNHFKPFPLMGMQQAYWIGRTGALVLGNVSCHVYLEMETSNFNIPLWEECWNRLIRKHDMLRCIILDDGNQQILSEVPHFSIPVYDATMLDEQAAEQRVLQCREQMGHEVLSAKEWPLYQVAVTKLPHDVVRLHISLDLLVADLHSMNLMMNDLESMYLFPEKEEKELSFSFRDYVLALEDFKNHPRYIADKEYWMKRVPSLAPAPDLPLAISPSQVERPEFVRHAARLNRELWSKLRQKASAYGVTTSALLLTCYAEVLARWSSREDFSINVTLFNRLPMNVEVPEIVGDFTSVSLLACCFDGSLSFLERVRSLQNRLWEDMDHSLFSGVDVIREWSRIKGTSSSDIIPIVFTSTIGFGDEHGTHPSLQTFGNITYNITQTPQVWIDHQVREINDELDFNWDAVDELFPAGLVDDMFAAYARLLKMLATDDRIWSHTRLPLLPQEQLERRRAVNATGKIFPNAGRKTLDDLFANALKEYPQALALTHKDVRLSYEELGCACEALCQTLLEQGCGRGSLVAVVSDGGWEEVVAALAITRVGAAYMPVDAHLPLARLTHLLEYSHASMVVTQAQHSSLEYPVGLPVVFIGAELLRTKVKFDFTRQMSQPEDLAYIIHTSGSTGMPKGVMIRHERACNTILAVNELVGLTSQDRVLALSRFTFDLSVWDIFGLLAVGGAIIIPDTDKRLDANHWLELMTEQGVTVWNTVPPLMQILTGYMDHHPVQNMPPLSKALFSGDWIPLSLPKRVHGFWPDLKLYGLGGATEASIWSNYFLVEEVQEQWKSIPYGKPLANQHFVILNQHGTDCPDRVAGQLHIAGSGLSDGYLNDMLRTSESFILHPSTGEPLYATGDLGCYMSDGNIEFLGRKDNQVKINGYRIELGEIENTLMEHALVGQASALAVKGKQAGQVLAAFVAPKDKDHVPSVADLQQWLESRLPSFLVPSMILIRDELPLTSSGKVDRKQLTVRQSDQMPQAEGAKPKTNAEHVIAEVVSSVLTSSEVGIDKRFFEMGLSSLDLVSLQTQLETTLHRSIPLMVLLEHTSIRKLAKWIDQQEQSKNSAQYNGAQTEKGDASLNRGMSRAERRLRNRTRQQTVR